MKKNCNINGETHNYVYTFNPSRDFTTIILLLNAYILFLFWASRLGPSSLTTNSPANSPAIYSSPNPSSLLHLL